MCRFHLHKMYTGDFVSSQFMVLVFIILNVYPVTKATEVKIVTILPAEDKMLFSINRIAPAIEMAVEELHENNRAYFSKYVNFSVKYADSKCDISAGMNEAINLYIQGTVHLFLGPVCDYSVAPVARQVKYWNVPLISGGAMARDFVYSRSSEYPLLTRVGPVNFSALSMFFVKFFAYSKWKKVKLLYEKKGHQDVFEDYCHLMVTAIHYDILDQASWIKQDYFKLDENMDLEQVLAKEIGLSFGGK